MGQASSGCSMIQCIGYFERKKLPSGFTGESQLHLLLSATTWKWSHPCLYPQYARPLPDQAQGRQPPAVS